MRCILFVIVIAFASHAFAQETCESVIRLSKVVSDTVLDRESVDQHATNFCSEYRQSKTSGKSMDVGASYKALAATFKNSSVSADDIASKYCSASQGYSARKDAYKQYVEAIAPRAYDSYDKCIELGKKDLNLTLESFLAKEFRVVAAYKSGVEKGPDAYISYIRSEGVTCSWNRTTEDVQQLKTGGSAVLTCKRADPKMKTDVTIIRNNSATERMTLHWPEFNTEGHPVDSLKALQDKVSALESRLSTISQSGEIKMKAVNTPGLEEYGHGSTKRGELEGEVKFPVAFSTTPTVSAGLTSLLIGTADVRDRHSVRFEVGEVKKEGFKYKFWTEGDNKISIAIIRWIAVVK